jgi:hypothetical protein
LTSKERILGEGTRLRISRNAHLNPVTPPAVNFSWAAPVGKDIEGVQEYDPLLEILAMVVVDAPDTSCSWTVPVTPVLDQDTTWETPVKNVSELVGETNEKPGAAVMGK